MLRYCHQNSVKVVPRGAGTSLSGGALPLEDGVLLGMSKFSRIRDIDFDNRVVVAEPGVTNLGISNAVAHRGGELVGAGVGKALGAAGEDVAGPVVAEVRS